MLLDTQHHIAVIVSDYDRAKEFYVNKLGFQVLREVYRPDQGDYLRLLRLGQTTIELFVKPDAPARPTRPEALGLRHLAFHVEDVAAAAAWLESMGIPTEPIREDPYNGGRFTFFRDPDGLPLEVHE